MPIPCLVSLLGSAMSSPRVQSLLLLVLLLAAVVLAAPRPSAPPPRDIYRLGRSATVWIHGSDGSKGTGWVQDRARRRIVTAHHVVGDGNTVEVFIPTAANEQAHYLEHRERLRREGSVVRGRVIRRSPEMDLALVEVESLAEGTTALPLARSSARPGDRVHPRQARLVTAIGAITPDKANFGLFCRKVRRVSGYPYTTPFDLSGTR